MNAGVLEQIQLAVNSYYAQFEESGEGAAGDADADLGASDGDGPPVRLGPMVLPGLPVEGAQGEEDDDEEIPLDDFDTIKLRSSSMQRTDEDKDADEGSEADELDDRD